MPRSCLTLIAFDADDTLWHNERFFRLTQNRFTELLKDYTDPDHLDERLNAAERRNLGRYGFGIKGFVLSMIETALEVTDHRVSGDVISELVEAGKDMLAHPIELLPHVEDVLSALHSDFRLILITKGDLLDQERKLAQSGLGEMFQAVEIVSDKTEETYRRILGHQNTAPECAMMVGNSIRSDILPMLAAGGWAGHVPHDLTWSYEASETPLDHRRFFEIASLSDLPEIVKTLSN